MCTFVGYLPSSNDYDIQWRNDNGDIITSDGYYVIVLQQQHDQLVSNLIIPSLSGKDNGNYTCELLSYNITGIVEVRIRGKASIIHIITSVDQLYRIGYDIICSA